MMDSRSVVFLFSLRYIYVSSRGSALAKRERAEALSFIGTLDKNTGGDECWNAEGGIA